MCVCAHQTTSFDGSSQQQQKKRNTMQNLSTVNLYMYFPRPAKNLLNCRILSTLSTTSPLFFRIFFFIVSLKYHREYGGQVSNDYATTAVIVVIVPKYMHPDARTYFVCKLRCKMMKKNAFQRNKKPTNERMMGDGDAQQQKYGLDTLFVNARRLATLHFASSRIKLALAIRTFLAQKKNGRA